jgi:hypothetical protein
LPAEGGQPDGFRLGGRWIVDELDVQERLQDQRALMGGALDGQAEGARAAMRLPVLDELGGRGGALRPGCRRYRRLGGAGGEQERTAQ